MSNRKSLAFLTAGLMFVLLQPMAVAGSPGQFGPWKAVGKLKLPSPATGMVISEDGRLALVLCSEKRQRNSGGFGPGVVEVFILRCFNLDTGKEVITGGLSQLAPRMSLRKHRVAISDTFDKITVYDLDAGKKLCLIDPRSANDSPNMKIKGVPPELQDFGGGGRLSDLEFTGDARVLVTVRKENTPWKNNGKGAFTSESFERVVFWDAEKGTRLATLDCEDRQQYNGHLTLMPGRQQMLARFANGVRVLDLSTKKWAKSLVMRDVWGAALSADERTIAVTCRDQTVRILDSNSLKTLRTFKEQAVNTMPRLDGSLNPMGFEFGPTAEFADGDRALRIVLNDQNTVIYRDAKTGAKILTPASENHSFPGGARLLALSPSRLCAITTSTFGTSTFAVWRREALERK